jgi:hypothetical protein
MTPRWMFGTAAATALLLLASIGTEASTVRPSGVSAPSVVRLGDYHHVSMKLDANGKVHAVAAGTSGLWYITNKSGSFTRHRITTVVSQPLATGLDDYPSIALDAHGNAHVVFVRWTCFDCTPNPPKGIYYLTNKSGSWSTPKQLAGADASAPSLRVRGGHIFVAWERCACIPELPAQVWYGTNVSGSWTKVKVAENATHPSLALTSTGKPRIAFARQGIRYAIGASSTGNFSKRLLTGTTSHDSAPALALMPNGRPIVMWSHFGGANAGTWDGRRTGPTSWTTRKIDNQRGVNAVDSAQNGLWYMGLAYTAGGGAAVLAMMPPGGFGTIVSSTSTLDGISVAASTGRTVWLYTVTAGDPAGIYEVHT